MLSFLHVDTDVESWKCEFDIDVKKELKIIINMMENN